MGTYTDSDGFERYNCCNGIAMNPSGRVLSEHRDNCRRAVKPAKPLRRPSDAPVIDFWRRRP